MGRAYLSRCPPDVTVVIVPCGYGENGFRSSSITPTPAGYEAASNGTWDRTLTADPNNLYSRMVADVAAARAAAGAMASETPKLVGLAWSQGENDYDMMTGTDYAAALDDMIGAFRAAVGDAALPVFVGSLVPEFIGGAAAKQAVQDALMDTPRRLVNTAFVYGPKGMVRSDQAAMIHYATVGQTRRGRMFVDAIERARWNITSAKAVPPQNLRVIRSGTTLTAEYDPPPTRHTAITVEYSTDGGSTWTAMTKVGGAIGLSASATIGASDVVEVRASSTNETNTSTYVTAAA